MLHGKMVRPTAFAPRGSYTRSPENLVNDSDMSGFGGMNHTCGTDLESMWLTERGAGENNWVGFDFGSVIRLGHLCVWNFNQADGYLAGLKSVRLEYSCDGETYFEYKGEGYPYEFACADGSDSLKATNLNDGKHSPVDFAGLSLRYLRIKPDAKHGVGNWGDYIEGQTRFGLSQVRFFLYREQPRSGGFAYAEAYIAEESSCVNVLTSTYGLDENGLQGTDARTMYISPLNPADTEIIFDMNMAATLDGVELYNYNAPDALGAGMRHIMLYHSIDGRDWTPFCEQGYYLQRGTGKPGMAASKTEDGKDIRFPATYCRKIKLSVVGGPGEGTHGVCNGYEFRYGLSKVRFRFAQKGYFAEPARDWTAMLSGYNGWTGADGIFTASLDGVENKREGAERNDVQSLLLFSDSFLGSVNPVTGVRRRADVVNNTLGYLTGTDPDNLSLRFEYGRDGKMTHDSILKNDNPWIYWMQDCVILNNRFHVLTDNVVTDTSPDLQEGFQFRVAGVDMITFDVKDGKLDYSTQKNHSTPLLREDGGRLMYFGCGNLANTAEAGMPFPDGYLYVYGMTYVSPGGKDLLVARVKPEDILNFDKYRFYDGKGWSENILDSAPICNELSPEMSVSPISTGVHQGKYLFTYMRGGVGEKVMLRIGETPYGPFSEPFYAYFAGDAEDLDKSVGKKIYHYNAKAHYHIAEVGEALVTYNTNTMDYESHFKNGNIYRPRFVRIREYE